MKVLALDTSGPSESIAILEGGQVIGECFTEKPPSHSLSLLPSLDNLLQAHQLKLTDIELYAITVGPGSFTGLRIGLSSLKGLASAHSCPVAPVSTLSALCEPYLDEEESLWVSCVRGFQGQVYAAAYERCQQEPRQKCLWEPASYTPAQLYEAIQRLSGKKILLGSGVQDLDRLKSVPEDVLDGTRVLRDKASMNISAVSVGRLGIALHQRGESIISEKLCAEYIRPSEAERKLQESKAKV